MRGSAGSVVRITPYGGDQVNGGAVRTVGSSNSGFGIGPTRRYRAVIQTSRRYGSGCAAHSNPPSRIGNIPQVLRGIFRAQLNLPTITPRFSEYRTGYADCRIVLKIAIGVPGSILESGNRQTVQ